MKTLKTLALILTAAPLAYVVLVNLLLAAPLLTVAAVGVAAGLTLTIVTTRAR